MQPTNQPQDQKHPLREAFLEMFVREIISNAYNPEKDKELQEKYGKFASEEITKQIRKNQAHIITTAPNGPILKTVAPQQSQFPPTLPKTLGEIKNFQKKFNLSEPQRYPQPARIPLNRISPISLPQQNYQPTKLKPGQKIETVNLGKLANVLIDPSVMSIECPGPFKNLLVNRSGSIQTSAITLTPDEINSIMNNISQQTRIPVTLGVFRAALQDLVVTAVLSDFVGTRFVIQKRNPFMRF